MLKTIQILGLSLILYGLTIYQSHAACSVSIPNLADPIGTLKTSAGFGWFGSNRLAAIIPSDGHWRGMGPTHNYRNKFWWWREDLTKETMPEQGLVIKAVNLGTREAVTVTTSGYAFEGSDNYQWNAMLAGMEFPSPGCWQITGSYKDQELTITVWVE